ncbi:hypothetical protein SUGI_0327220 [Cryptomeria japonica]|nr:hypothetical protein SUGI_0327220 [Cryptomeria japonica]
MLGNLPSPREMVELLKRHNIGKVRIFEAHHEALRALENTGIEVTEELEKIAGNQRVGEGQRWRLLPGGQHQIHFSGKRDDKGVNHPRLITESGWPSAGDDNDHEARAATVDNALIRHVSSNQGTPRRPGKPIDAYVFSLFKKNLKPGPEIERHFGLFYPNKNPVYPVNFTPY